MFRSFRGPSRSLGAPSRGQKDQESMKSLVAAFGLAAFGAVSALAGDWPEWRGPARDGASAETQLPSRWSPAGEGLAWKAPYGSRSTPVIFGSRLYLWNASVDTVKERDKVQERLLALDADTGKLDLGEALQRLPHRRSGAPHRVGFAERRSRDGQRLRLRRGRAPARARRRRQACCGSASSPRSTARSRRTAAAPSRR